MPRTLLDKHNERYGALGRKLAGAMAYGDIAIEEILNILGHKDPRTARKYIRKPQKLTVEEMLDIGRKAHIPIEELRQCLHY